MVTENLEFSVVGLPNEGKSSVVATLVEDDTIRISPWPGETRESRAYAVQAKDSLHLLFSDTPGFQSPKRTLSWIQDHGGTKTGKDLAQAFCKAHDKDPDFVDECQIFSALMRSAGVLYVVNAGRTVRKADLAEMEILRLVGLSRMAVINAGDSSDAVEEWKNALRKTFNAVHMFNALTAGFKERIRLLSALKSMDSDMEPLLQPVIHALEADWEGRILLSAKSIQNLVAGVSAYALKAEAADEKGVALLAEKLTGRWQEGVRILEETCWKQLREIFRHRFFSPSPDILTLLETDLLSRESFRMFGLSRLHLAAIGAGGGAAMAAGVDLALGGAALGLVTAAGGLVGAACSYLGTRSGEVRRVAGIRISRFEVSVGPVQDMRIPWMVLDRSLLLFHALVTRPHAARDKERGSGGGLWNFLEKEERKALNTFIRNAARKKKDGDLDEKILRLLADVLRRLSLGAPQKK